MICGLFGGYTACEIRVHGDYIHVKSFLISFPCICFFPLLLLVNLFLSKGNSMHDTLIYSIVLNGYSIHITKYFHFMSFNGYYFILD